MNAMEKLNKRLNNNFHICVGLDSDLNKIPKHLLDKENPVLKFNKEIINATHDIACCYKINLAFYEKYGLEGFKILEKTIALIPEEVHIIGDAKRGDIGNTSQMYAQAIFDEFKFDSITLHPYMGIDSIEPFLDYSNKLSFILALTSNKGSADFEKLELKNGNKVFQEVIEKVKTWNVNNNCGLVFGATNNEELLENINRFDDMPILLPGVGAQGGSLEDVVKIFRSVNKNNFIVNVSRGLLYKNSTEEFAKHSRLQLENYNNTVLSEI